MLIAMLPGKGFDPLTYLLPQLAICMRRNTSNDLAQLLQHLWNLDTPEEANYGPGTHRALPGAGENIQ